MAFFVLIGRHSSYIAVAVVLLNATKDHNDPSETIDHNGATGDNTNTERL